MIDTSSHRKALSCLAIFLCGIAGSRALAAEAGRADQALPQKLLLIPAPREAVFRASCPLAHGLGISVPGADREDRFAADDLAGTLRQRGIAVTRREDRLPRVVLLRSRTSLARAVLARTKLAFEPAMHEEGYAIVWQGNALYVIGETAAGVFYGAQTVKQLVRGYGKAAALTGAVIRDWPALRYRGQQDDLSRGPMPTLEFQKKQIRTFAAFKINVYSPYFEQTMAYAAHPLPAPPGGTLSQADARDLVAYAGKYHVTVIPEQEAFGHLHHVLKFEQYADLAETPHGTVLAPDQPGSLQLIQSWFTELASVYPGPFVHIGADETFDLGQGRSQKRVAQEGLGKVYIDFLERIAAALAPLHKRILFWGDVAMNEPALVKSLPKGMIAVAWAYDPQPGGYDRWLKPFVDAGMETWVAPGVNNWNRVYPDCDAALQNIQRFVSDGQRLGSTGELNTVWNDDGEGLFLQDWYGVLFGAAAGWQPGPTDIGRFQDSYGRVFHGDETGRIDDAQRELIAAHQVLSRAQLWGSQNGLFWEDPWSPGGQADSLKILPAARELRLHAERALTLIWEAEAAGPLRESDAIAAMELGARRLDFIGLKFQIADEIAAEYARAYAASSGPSGQAAVSAAIATISGLSGKCPDLRDGYGLTRELFQEVWLKENRPYWLDNVLARYDLAMQMWAARSDRFWSAERQYEQSQVLPTPKELGLPSKSVGP